MTASEDLTSVTDPFRAELLALCYRMGYRMVGSADEAGDRDGVYRAHALQVLTVTSGGVARIVIFFDPGLFGSFRLPPVADRAGHRGAC
jgi:hypothetical protein